ncbi:hypothetical protein D3C75_797710 [compost metagenome]
MQQADAEHDHTDADGGNTEIFADLGQVFLKRGGILIGLIQQGSDFADLRGHSCGHCNAFTPAIGDQGGHKGNVFLVPQGQVGGIGGFRHKIRIFVHRNRFTC